MKTRYLILILITACVAYASLYSAYGGKPHWEKQVARSACHEYLWCDAVKDKRFERLTEYPGKTEIVCPKQNSRTVVLMLIGQSNAGNHQEHMIKSDYGDKLVNYANGKCYVAASPLIGATGRKGESWTLLGQKLISSGFADRVILMPAAVGGSTVGRWAAGGDLNSILHDVIDGRYKITYILWHQGESDLIEGTSEQDYRESFLSLVYSIRGAGSNAPIFISIASFCGHHVKNNPIAMVQASIPDVKNKIYAGVNTDKLMLPEDRFDGCHFGYSGQEKFASSWVEILKNSHTVQHGG